MLPKTKIILIGAGIVVVIIVGTVFGLWNGRRVKIAENKDTGNAAAVNSAVPTTASVETTVVTGADTRVGSLDAYATARFVAERFASFSAESSYSNIESLYSLFTADFQDWAKDYVSEGRSKTDSAQSYRVVARVLSVVSEGVSADSAMFVLRLQKEEIIGAAPAVVSQRNLQVDLVKTGSVWLVDRLKWE